MYYELNEGDEQTIDKINGGGFANSTGYLVLSGGTLNTTNSGGDGMVVNNDTDISTNNLILESGTINLSGALSFDNGESTIGSVKIVGGTTKLGIFANKSNEGQSSTVKLESDSTLYFNSGYVSLREDSTISVATDATDTTLIIEGANLTSIENPNVTPEDYILTISDITTVSIDDSTFDLAVKFGNIDSLNITDSTINYALTFDSVGNLILGDTTTIGDNGSILITGDTTVSGYFLYNGDDSALTATDESEVSLIKYSNVAQLQSINLLGSKDASNGVAGYDYWSVGSTANFDKILSENALVGASIGGTYNKVEGDAGETANSTTFLLNAYATYANEGLEVFANIGYSHFWNEGSKVGSGSADWDSDAFNFLIGASYKMETTVEGVLINPVAMLNLVCLDTDSASYSNGVTVDDQSYFSAKLMLGFEVEYAINAQFNVLARAMYSHEMGDTSYDNTYSLGFVNGVQYIGSEAGAVSAVMGLGLSYDFSETYTAYFDYNSYAYSNLITHTFNLSVTLKF